MAKELFSSLFNINRYTKLTSFMPWLANVWKFRIVSERAEQFFSQLFKDAIRQRELATGKSNIDFLDFLVQLKSKKPISDLDLTANGITFFFDAYETLAVGFVFILYEIARSKRVQGKLRQEILESNEISELLYLEQCIYEALRLHSPVPLMSKLCTESTEFIVEGKKMQIDRGDIVIIPLDAIHRDSDHYSEPDAFNPERFDADNGGIKDFMKRGILLPFSDGPRICLGMRFALLQIKSYIAEILKNFEIFVDSKTVEPLGLDPKHFLNASKNPIWLNFMKLR